MVEATGVGMRRGKVMRARGKYCGRGKRESEDEGQVMRARDKC